MSIDSLPDDLLLEILARVPAEDIHEYARLVCRKWGRIIRGDRFARAHFRRTCSGLLLAEFSDAGSSPAFLAAAQGGIQISKLRCKIDFPVLAGCNGLILGMELAENYRQYHLDPTTKRFVVNPATNRRFELPPFGSIGGEFLSLGGLGFFGLAYVEATTEYKVVATWCDSSFVSVAYCAVFTLGVDESWRRVPIEQLNAHAQSLLLEDPVMTTEGFIHWGRGNDVMSMNVETEVITMSPGPLLPQDRKGKRHDFYYLSTGRHLSALTSCVPFVWEVWEMNGESGEWRKLANKIDLKAHKHKMIEFSRGTVRPVSWVKYPDVIAFSGYGSNGSCIIYNLDKDGIEFFKVSGNEDVLPVALHRNSLVWFS